MSARLLRVRSDEQLVALFRAGDEDAFRVIHDRYRQRLFGYARQMLSGSTSDAEDALQDVFLRAYRALRADERPVSLRAWLYRVAHNRCIDQIRRPVPEAADVFDVSRTPIQDPMAQTERREDLRRLVDDVQRLPEQQRSALLMREMDGLTYAELADALDTSVPAVKSLLVRARVGLVEAIEARDTDCADIRHDLAAAYDRGVRASGRARRHLRECQGCRGYRKQLVGVRRGLGALSPGLGSPHLLIAKLLGLGGAGSGAAAGGAAAGGGGAAAVGGAAAGGGGAAVAGGAAAVSVGKVAAIVCCAAVVTGGAVGEVQHISKPAHRRAHAAPGAKTPAALAAQVAQRRVIAPHDSGPALRPDRAHARHDAKNAKRLVPAGLGLSDRPLRPAAVADPSGGSMAPDVQPVDPQAAGTGTGVAGASDTGVTPDAGSTSSGSASSGSASSGSASSGSASSGSASSGSATSGSASSDSAPAGADTGASASIGGSSGSDTGSASSTGSPTATAASDTAPSSSSAPGANGTGGATAP